MLNQLIIIGSVYELPVLKETNNGTVFTSILIRVKRNFKNADGEYGEDIIPCMLWRKVAEMCVEQVELGSLIAIKGRLQTNKYEGNDGVVKYYPEIYAEKVTFLKASE